ncbi:DUF3376 domain-containing protein [Agromyces sp. H3Y2-19a]|uniref:DUF3376 domain-containing protein n=1 Tax=Agromyces chromiiresistens TaxID=3030835 RepID=UPI0023B92C95|nr:DUF3376 domain-containing protein [Agromyces chromiiresistens]MDF0514910.1 DUF3376 domain-containing protein [Agromyces chromiiresistens]
MSDATVPHDYVKLVLDPARPRGRDGDLEYGDFPYPAGTDAAPGRHGPASVPDPNPRVYLPEGARPFHSRGLRVALAMKGGVSLAVWIGGAVAELDILRHIRIYRTESDPAAQALLIDPSDTAPDRSLVERADLYARLLYSRGYDRVEFDVLAGASAGGLNAVMYAVAQRAGVDVNGLLPVWLRAGSAWSLLQPGKPAAFDSVFRGDEYFWSELTKELTDIGRPADGEIPTSGRRALIAPHVVVDLSATLIDGRDTSERSAAEGHAHFRFVGTDGDPVPDRAVPRVDRLNDPRNVRFDRDVRRIAYAARTTSSFPGAFEPALIYSSDDALAAPDVVTNPPDMRNVFSAHRVDGAHHPFRVVDGGVLDNIPIDRALRAVRNIPANEHVNRVLVYLDPSPKETSHWLIRANRYEGPVPELPPDPRTERQDPLSRFLSPILAAVRKRASGENGEDEIDGVDAARTSQIVAKGRGALLAVRLDTRPATGSDGAATPDELAYASMRSATDLELLRDVLTRPGEWALGTDLLERPPHRALDRLDIGRFAPVLRSVIGEFVADGIDGVPPDAISKGAQALVDAAFACLAWVRAIEDHAFRSIGLAELDAVLGDRPGTADRTRQAVREALYATLRRARDYRDAAVSGVVDEVDGMSRQEHSLTPERARDLAVAWLAGNAASPRGRDALWAELDRIVGWLQHAGVELASDRSTRWSDSPWHRFPAPGERIVLARELPLIFGGSGIPLPDSTIRFHTIGSDTQPARVGHFRTLLDAQILEGYRAVLAKDPSQLDRETVARLLDDGALRSTSKLAGLRIAAFAGFMSRAWRRNDWWWGRLDAAAGLVRLLDSMEAAPAPDGTDATDQGPDRPAADPPRGALDVDDAVERVQDALLRQLDRDAGARPYADAVSSGEPDGIRGQFVRGAQDIEALGSGYRLALASRTVRTVSAAMVRGSGGGSPTRLMHWLLRPLLVLVPTLLSPPRLVLASVIIACGVLLTWPQLDSTLEPSATIGDSGAFIAVVTAALVAFVVLRLVSSARAHRAHARIVADVTNADSRQFAVIHHAERRSRPVRAALVVLAFGFIGLFVLACLYYPLWGVPFWVTLLAAVAVAEIAGRRLRTVPSARPSRPWRWVVAVVLSAAAVAVTAQLAVVLSSMATSLDAPWSGMLPGATAAAVVAAALAATLFAQAMRWRQLIAVVLVAGVLTALAVALTGWIFESISQFDALDVDTGTNALVDGALRPEVEAAAGLEALQTAIAFLVSAWVAGTVLWWAPWFRGIETGPAAKPHDGVYDLTPGSLVDRPHDADGERRVERRDHGSRRPRPATAPDRPREHAEPVGVQEETATPPPVRR